MWQKNWPLLAVFASTNLGHGPHICDIHILFAIASQCAYINMFIRIVQFTVLCPVSAFPSNSHIIQITHIYVYTVHLHTHSAKLASYIQLFGWWSWCCWCKLSSIGGLWRRVERTMVMLPQRNLCGASWMGVWVDSSVGERTYTDQRHFPIPQLIQYQYLDFVRIIHFMRFIFDMRWAVRTNIYLQSAKALCSNGWTDRMWLNLDPGEPREFKLFFCAEAKNKRTIWKSSEVQLFKE